MPVVETGPHLGKGAGEQGVVGAEERTGQHVGGPPPGGETGQGAPHASRPDHQLITWEMSSPHWLRKKRMRMKGRNMSAGWIR